MNWRSLSTEQKVGQLLMVDFQDAELTPGQISHFKRNHFSNYILFARNLKTFDAIARLTGGLQAAAADISQIPALIATDQEGGMVTRIYSGATHFPSNMAIMAAGMADKVETVARMTARELLALGVNFNLAPVMDINSNPLNPVIGVRSYSGDARVVAETGVSYINGLQTGGVVACAKHFPGHGDTHVDSHLGLPRLDLDLDALYGRELIPFIAAINAGVDAIMTAHIIFPKLDELPATISKPVLTGLLREKLGFEGLIVTDSVSMSAIRDYYTMEKACVMAIAAGADMVCLCGDMDEQTRCYEAVCEAVGRGEISAGVLDRAVERIMRVKEKYRVTEHISSDPETLTEKYPEHEALADQISRKSVTLIHDSGGLIPLGNASAFAVSPPPVTANIADDVIVAQEAFAAALARELRCPYAIMPLSPGKAEIEEILHKAESAEIVVMGSYNAIFNEGQCEMARAFLDAGKRVAVVSLRAPYDNLKLPQVDAYVCAYEYTPRSVRNSVDFLLGRLKP